MRWSLRLHLALALLLLLALCSGYRYYQDELPNGGRVAHPCKDNLIWYGVGHFNVLGGGDRNVFGMDFVAAGRTWTRALCQKDSDGDGRTNGQELGDPDCVWTKGQVPSSTSGITHPGVCEPLDSDSCRNRTLPQSYQGYKRQADWLADACRQDEFHCNATRQPDVKTVELRMPVTKVPAQETTYMCMTFEFPNISVDFHVIATEPVINNSYVMHHMLLFACPDTMAMRSAPTECAGMGQCSALVGAWAVGGSGQCFNREAGVLVGRSSYKKFVIQYHWNNPQRRDGYQDSSGLRLYYTPTLRRYNMAMMQVGQTYIQIPPRSRLTTVTGDCSPACTRSLFHGDINVVTAANHMHYLGVAMNLELYRGGQFVTNITNDPVYRYDTPRSHVYESPLVLKPGDEIRTNCHFSAPDKTKTTFYGEGTSDEMCFGFLTFYPQENMPHQRQCIQWRGYSGCDNEAIKDCNNEKLQTFSNATIFSQTAIYKNVTSACQAFGPCTDECKALVRHIRATETCFNTEDNWLILKTYPLKGHELGQRFIAAFTSCDLDIYQDDHVGCPSRMTPAYGGVVDKMAKDSAAPVTTVPSSLGLLTTLLVLWAAAAL